jgi:hypothetical protein
MDRATILANHLSGALLLGIESFWLTDVPKSDNSIQGCVTGTLVIDGFYSKRSGFYRANF